MHLKDDIERALKLKLYVPGFFFEKLYRQFPEYIKKIAIVDSVAVAIVFEYPEEYEIYGEQIGCFVHPKYRRQGYGTKAIEAVGGIRDREWRIGEEGSGHFWTNFAEYA